MSVDQTQFRDALMDSNRPVPEGLSDGRGQPAGARFSVYRNNVAASLTEALEVSFPAVLKLIGAENFKNVAGRFLRQHPPQSPMIMTYGADFPQFLGGFAPLQHIGYLPDVARLEQALRESYHAADADPVQPSVLAALSEDRLTKSCIQLAPALRLIRSNWPVHAIWSYSLQDGAPKPRNTAQDVLVTRPALDPECHPLCAGGGPFVAALLAGATLGQAVESATETASDFDLTAVLTLLLNSAAISGLQIED